MNFEIKFTPEAEETYVTVMEQLRQRWGDKFVLKLASRISKCLDVLASTPYLYPIIDETTGIRRCVLHKNCSMLYNIYDDASISPCFGITVRIPYSLPDPSPIFNLFKNTVKTRYLLPVLFQ
jgi:hypothetical protein